MSERDFAALRVSIVGLGKLGAAMAAAVADRGHTVVGYDVDPRPVRAIAAGRAPMTDPLMQEMIARSAGRLSVTQDLAAAVHGTDVTFVVVPTPSEPSGALSIAQAERAFSEIGTALADKEAYHLVVLTSTVLPGATRHGL